MAMGRPKATLVLDTERREQLESLANSRSLPDWTAASGQYYFAERLRKDQPGNCATSGDEQGYGKPPVATDSSNTGCLGFYEQLGPGRPRPISDERVAQLVRKTLKTKPKHGTHWSIRQLTTETGLSESTVHRIWQAFRLQPHRQESFKLSSDPFLHRVFRRVYFGEISHRAVTIF